MKKILFFVAFSMLFVHCKKQAPEDKSGATDTTATNVAAKAATTALACEYQLFLIKDSLPPGFFEQNDSLICVNDTTIVTVDLTNMKTGAEMGDWLKANDRYIDFEKSYTSISNAHKITVADYPFLDSIPASDFTSFTIGAIKEKVLAKLGSFKNQYQEYTVFVKTGPALSIKVDKYDPNQDTYSVPFFNSLIKNYNLKNSSTLQFTTQVIDSLPSVVLRFKDATGSYQFFDISNNPTFRPHPRPAY